MKWNPPALAVVMAVLTLTAAIGMTAVVPANAQTDDTGEDSVVDALFHDEDEDGDTGGLQAIIGFANGVMAKYNPLADRPEQASADEYVGNVRSTFNSNNQTLMNWTNARATADGNADVVRMKFTDEDGNSEYLFVVADVNATTGNYTSAKAMNLTEFKSSGREYDMTYRLSPYASRNANAELETFISEYAAPGEDLNQSYLAEMAGEYRGEVSGDDLPGEGQ